MSTPVEEPLPSAWGSFGCIHGRVIQAVGDDSDADLLPGAKPVTGAGLVTLTCLDGTRVVTDTDSGQTAVVPQAITCDLDSEGYLALNSQRDVWLWAGNWKIAFASSVGLPSWQFTVAGTETSAAPLQVMSKMGVTPPSGAVITTVRIDASVQPGQALTLDQTGAVVVGVNITEPTWDTLANKPAVIAAGTDEASARAAIAAGTSNLALGATATDAAPGNHLHDSRYVRTVNGTGPDGAGNVVMAGGSGVRNWWPNRWCVPGSIIVGSGIASGGASTANTAYLTPIHLAAQGTLTGIALGVATAAAAGSKARLGVYSIPMTLTSAMNLVLDAGEVAVDVTGMVSVTVSQVLAAGDYAICLLNGAGAPVFYAQKTASGLTGLDLVRTDGYETKRWLIAAQTYGALPASITPGWSVGWEPADTGAGCAVTVARFA